MPDVPLTPARLASARSSGSTMVDREPAPLSTEAWLVRLDCLWSRCPTADQPSVLSPAVMTLRSVSVTDFLSSPADHFIQGVRCIQPIRRVRPIIDSATVIAGIGGQAANLVHEKNLVVVLAARQYLCRCRSCDCWTGPRIARFPVGSKQPLPQRYRSAWNCDSRAPANSVAGGHLGDAESICGTVLQRFPRQLQLCGQCD